MDDKILFLYAQGMTTREIVATFSPWQLHRKNYSLVKKEVGQNPDLPSTGTFLSVLH